jgi:L-asparaginase II
MPNDHTTTTPNTATSVSQSSSGNPHLIEVTRGTLVESRHRAAFAVTDTDGRVVLGAGDVEAPVYARSAIKPLQALPLIESGAADAHALGNAEIALACASHNGEPRHVETVLAWLKRIDCTVADLECGSHLPKDDTATQALLRGQGNATPAHNNCSGKHTGFLTLARHMGTATKGYIAYSHAVQQWILGVLETMTGLDLDGAPRGIDGCGIPVIGMPLGNLALAFARLTDPRDQPEARQAACERVCTAMTAEPFMVAGSGRYCTRVMLATGGDALIKTGAEGVYCGALPKLGLGIALKVDDGATRAAEVLMGRILRHFGALDDSHAELLTPPLHNVAGTRVGEIRATADFPE